MTENEAKEMLEVHYEFLRESWKPYPDGKVLNALKIAISSINKIQQYRAVGTVEECREAKKKQEPMCLYNKKAPFIGEITKIQCHCPRCDIILGVEISENPIIQEEIRYCFNCGQKLYR